MEGRAEFYNYQPTNDARLESSLVQVFGWVWNDDGNEADQVRADENEVWLNADVEPRHDFSWQNFSRFVTLPPGKHQLTARATSSP
jgi:hypothetical protein